MALDKSTSHFPLGKYLYRGIQLDTGEWEYGYFGTVVEIVRRDNYCWGYKVIVGDALPEGFIFPLRQWDNCEKNEYGQLQIVGTVWEEHYSRAEAIAVWNCRYAERSKR